MKRFFIIVFVFLSLAGIAVTGNYLISDPAKDWNVQGNALCHKRYGICVSNEPHWVPHFSKWFTLKGVQPLLVLQKPMPGAANKQVLAQVMIFPPENLNRRNVQILKPVAYLQFTLQSTMKIFSKVEEIKPPSADFLNGREVATARYILTPNEKGHPSYSMYYAFVDGNQGCVIGYYAGYPDEFEANLNEGMSIISSFQCGWQETR